MEKRYTTQTQIDQQREKDLLMLDFLREQSVRDDNLYIGEIASRFESLLTKAHTRMHWCGVE